jgi:proteic killer suppression protein
VDVGAEQEAVANVVLGTLADAADVRGVERRERPLASHGALASVGVEDQGPARSGDGRAWSGVAIRPCLSETYFLVCINLFRQCLTTSTLFLDIVFANSKLRKQCNDTKKAVRALGKRQAQLVRRRLDDLNAADNLVVMRVLSGRCHELKGDRAGQLSLDLEHPYRLIFEPAANPAPTKPDGGLDWSAVDAVRILAIEDTHG